MALACSSVPGTVEASLVGLSAAAGAFAAV